jgi:hypothetical protein
MVSLIFGILINSAILFLLFLSLATIDLQKYNKPSKKAAWAHIFL